VDSNKTEVSYVDGYKEFKFGMSPTDISKLTACSKVDYQTKVLEHTQTLTKQIEEDTNNLPYWTSTIEDLQNRTNMSVEEITSKGMNRPNQGELENAKWNLGDRKERIKTNKDNLNNPEKLIKELLSCEVTFSGEKIRPELVFNDATKLSAIKLIVGNYAPAKQEAIVGELGKKYKLTSEPTDDQLQSFLLQTDKKDITWLFENGSVGFTLYYSGFGLDNIAMKISYKDSESARKMLDSVNNSKLKSNDL
jgi:hypothetical protein